MDCNDLAGTILFLSFTKVVHLTVKIISSRKRWKCVFILILIQVLLFRCNVLNLRLTSCVRSCLWPGHFAVDLRLSWNVFDVAGYGALLSNLVLVDKALYDLDAIENLVKIRSFTFDIEQLFNALISQNLLINVFIGLQIVN